MEAVLSGIGRIPASGDWFFQRKPVEQCEALAEMLQAAYSRRPITNKHWLVDRQAVLTYARRGEWWLVKGKIYQTHINDEDATQILNAIVLLD